MKMQDLLKENKYIECVNKNIIKWLNYHDFEVKFKVNEHNEFVFYIKHRNGFSFRLVNCDTSGKELDALTCIKGTHVKHITIHQLLFELVVLFDKYNCIHVFNGSALSDYCVLKVPRNEFICF